MKGVRNVEETYGEFSFNGHSCTEFGLHYIPGASERWFSSTPWKTMEESVTGKAGAYYYGSTVSVREFSLDCYFEDASIERLEAIERWLNRFAEGKLIFDDRPYVYYMARPSAPSKGKTWAHEYYQAIGLTGSGTCTLSFKAYMPYGMLDRISYDGTNPAKIGSMINRTGLMLNTKTPSTLGNTAGTYLIYNPGTEFTYPTLKFYGKAPNGLVITNYTTNEKCSLAAFNLASGQYLEVHAETGVRLQPSDTIAFEYHLDGYISLAPCIPYDRKIYVSYVSGSNEVAVQDMPWLNDEYVGRYIYLNQVWRKILYVRDSGKTLVVNATMNQTADELTDIVVMNEINLSGTSLALTDVQIDYTAYVR